MTKRELLLAIDELVSGLSYKPGWRFTWRDGDVNGAVGKAVMVYVNVGPLPSAHGTGDEVTIMYPLEVKCGSLKYLDKETVWHITKSKIADLVEMIELHESREWLKSNGVSITPAHGPRGEFLPLEGALL